MKTYTYYFVDGTQSEVSATDEMYEILEEMDREERNNNRKNTRRHISISDTNDKNENISDPRGNAYDEIIRRAGEKKFERAMSTLTEKQQELVCKRFDEVKSVGSIAAEEGVDISAISHRLDRIEKKLKKFFC